MKAARTYSLEWLDSLISVTLNPERPYLEKIPKEDIASWHNKVPPECMQVQYEITQRIFSINKENQVRHLVRKYHAALLALDETLESYQSCPAFDQETLKELACVLSSGLKGLSSFIRKRYPQYLDTACEPLNASRAAKPFGASAKDSGAKVLCNLSGDQIALILRAADEAQILKARSMNAVFKAIVPYLSTQLKDTLSVDSIRSKAYSPEEPDREAAIEALQKIIRKIQGY